MQHTQYTGAHQSGWLSGRAGVVVQRVDGLKSRRQRPRHGREDAAHEGEVHRRNAHRRRSEGAAANELALAAYRGDGDVRGWVWRCSVLKRNGCDVRRCHAVRCSDTMRRGDDMRCSDAVCAV